MSRILIIEDEQILRETLFEILEISGYDVVQAKDGEEGVEAFAQTAPDLIICDIHMPKKDGFAVLKMIETLTPASKFPPFIFISAKVEPENIRKGMDLGATDFITKPYSTPELLKIIKLRLEKRKELQTALIEGEGVRISQVLQERVERLITAAEAEIKNVAGRLDKIPKEEQGLLNDSSELLHQAIAEMSSISNKLKPDLINTPQLESYLNLILNPVDSFPEIELDFNLNSEIGLLHHQLQLYICLLLKEVIINTRKHAEAKTVLIKVIVTKNETQIYFQDDGVGFNTNEPTEGKGLQNLREKIAKLNGKSTLESKPNQGTRMHLSLRTANFK